MILLWIIASVVVIFGIVTFVGAPYVPSLKKDISIAFDELYPIKSSDVVLDIGSGDGVVLREIARRGGRAIGYEINPILVGLSKLFTRNNRKVETRLANFWNITFPNDTTAVYVFAVSRDTKRVAKKMQQQADYLNKTLYLLSYGATIPGVKLTKQAGAHHLYTFTPLHAQKPQV